jgi:hypothetical protein
MGGSPAGVVIRGLLSSSSRRRSASAPTYPPDLASCSRWTTARTPVSWPCGPSTGRTTKRIHRVCPCRRRFSTRQQRPQHHRPKPTRPRPTHPRRRHQTGKRGQIPEGDRPTDRPPHHHSTATSHNAEPGDLTVIGASARSIASSASGPGPPITSWPKPDVQPLQIRSTGHLSPTASYGHPIFS